MWSLCCTMAGGLSRFEAGLRRCATIPRNRHPDWVLTRASRVSARRAKKVFTQNGRRSRVVTDHSAPHSDRPLPLCLLLPGRLSPSLFCGGGSLRRRQFIRVVGSGHASALQRFRQLADTAVVPMGTSTQRASLCPVHTCPSTAEPLDQVLFPGARGASRGSKCAPNRLAR